MTVSKPVVGGAGESRVDAIEFHAFKARDLQQ
jgi:hypothetical protein